MVGTGALQSSPFTRGHGGHLALALDAKWEDGPSMARASDSPTEFGNMAFSVKLHILNIGVCVCMCLNTVGQTEHIFLFIYLFF